VLLDIYVYELEKPRKGKFATKTMRVKKEIAGYAEVLARVRCRTMAAMANKAKGTSRRGQPRVLTGKILIST
jgi:phage tail tape-measure protein